MKFHDDGTGKASWLNAALPVAMALAVNLGCLTSSSGKINRPTGNQSPPLPTPTSEEQGSKKVSTGSSSQAADTGQPQGTGQDFQGSKGSSAAQNPAGDDKGSTASPGGNNAEPGSAAKGTPESVPATAISWTAQIAGSQVEPQNAQSTSDGASGAAGRSSSSGSTGGANAHPTSGASKEGILELSIRLNSPEIEVGEILVADVISVSPVRVVDAPLTLEYNASMLRYLDASQGEFLTRGGGSVVFLANGEARPGQVDIGIGRTDRSRGVAGEGTLCRVRFMTLATGAASLQIRQAMAWGERGAVIRVESNSVVAAVR